MSRDRFLEEYEYGVDLEFENEDGEQAEWANGHGLHWGEEDSLLQLPQDDPNKANVPSAAAALSPDGLFLAASTNATVRIYDISTKEIRAELVGHTSNVWKIRWSPRVPAVATTDDEISKIHYVLASEGAEVSGRDGDIILWNLSSDGKSVIRTMPFAVGSLTDKAMAGIEQDLRDHHDLEEGKADGIVSNLRQDFKAALQVADAKNRRRPLNLYDGHFPSFGSDSWSKDGRRLLYITHGQTTQHGMRPPDDLPQIVVLTLGSQIPVILKGHTDAIMWAQWSPNEKLIATAAWDSTYRIWDPATGECKHVIGPTAGQNWCGCFSPDSKHVILSGGGVVSLYDVNTAKEVAQFRPPHKSRSSWFRRITWSPSGDDVAIVVGQAVVLWQPFAPSDTTVTSSARPDIQSESAVVSQDRERDQSEPAASEVPSGKTRTVFKLKYDGSMLDGFCQLTHVGWLDKGGKLTVQDSEGTVEVWDRVRNVKWRFQRPKGFVLKVSSGRLFYLEEQKMLGSLDGDWSVRFWKL